MQRRQTKWLLLWCWWWYWLRHHSLSSWLLVGNAYTSSCLIILMSCSIFIDLIHSNGISNRFKDNLCNVQWNKTAQHTMHLTKTKQKENGKSNVTKILLFSNAIFDTNNKMKKTMKSKWNNKEHPSLTFFLSSVQLFHCIVTHSVNRTTDFDPFYSRQLFEFFFFQLKLRWYG